MKTISRKTLFLAIAGISAAGAVGTAQAVSVAPTQLGQVLIYPYYTVKGTDANPFNTLLSVVNTTGFDEGGQGPLPRRQGLGGSSRLQLVPVAVRRVDRGARSVDLGRHEDVHRRHVLHDPEDSRDGRRVP